MQKRKLPKKYSRHQNSLSAFKKKLEIISCQADPARKKSNRSPIKDALYQFKITWRLFQANFTRVDITFLENLENLIAGSLEEFTCSEMFQTVKCGELC